MRSAAIAVGVLAWGLAAAAGAADFIVVKTTDPGVPVGRTFDSGQRIPLATGKRIVLLAVAGDVTALVGGAAGAVAPARKASPADFGKLDAVRVILLPPPGRTFGGRRSGICPDAGALETLDEILAAQRSGCGSAARAALEALADTAEPE